MPRLLGVEIPNDKKIEYSLRYLYGIGPHLSSVILEKAGIDPNVRAHTLSEEELNKITQVIGEMGLKVEGVLRREISGNLKRLQAIKSYRGIRHLKRLPVRGQRTRSNARTRKGGRKTVGVMQKSAAKPAA